MVVLIDDPLRYFFIHLYAIIEQSTHPSLRNDSKYDDNMWVRLCATSLLLLTLPIYMQRHLKVILLLEKVLFTFHIIRYALGTFFDIELYFSKFIAHCICEHSNKCFWNYINHMLFPCFLTLMRKWEYFMKLSEFLMSEFSMISFETF